MKTKYTIILTFCMLTNLYARNDFTYKNISFYVKLVSKSGNLKPRDLTHFYRVYWSCAGNTQFADIKSGNSVQWNTEIPIEMVSSNPFVITKIVYYENGKQTLVNISEVDNINNYNVVLTISDGTNSDGASEDATYIKCRECRGAGIVENTKSTLDRNGKVISTVVTGRGACWLCKGSGKVKLQ